jgi:hypothetical protein
MKNIASVQPIIPIIPPRKSQLLSQAKPTLDEGPLGLHPDLGPSKEPTGGPFKHWGKASLYICIAFSYFEHHPLLAGAYALLALIEVWPSHRKARKTP